MKLLKIPKTTLFILCASSSLLIAGCSSSDNSRPSSNAVSNPQQSSPEVASTTVVGNVVKGTVQNADVYFYSVNNGKIAGSPFASAKTDDSGLFTASVPTKDCDAVYIEVQGAADGSSTMICDAEICGVVGEIEGDDADGSGAFEFGEEISLSDEFKLSAIISDYKSSPEVHVSVTPISHFAAQRIKKKGNISHESIFAELSSLSFLLNLPAELSKVIAVDITKTLSGELDHNSVRYSLYSAAIAKYAHKHHLSISDAIKKIEAKLIDDEGYIDRELLLELMRYARQEADRLIKGHPQFHRLISDILHIIGHYECTPRDGKPCGPIKPPHQPIPPVGELAKVKGFVKDFRSWVRELAAQNNPALANFKARTEMVGKLWEDDVKVLASALNDVLPGVAQAVSPTYSFCYYCETGGLAFSAAATEKELTIGDLHYRLSSDGTLDIEGSIRDVGVDIQLQLPTPEEWGTAHSIDITAGRLSRENMELVITKGSTITAVFPENLSFEEIIGQVQNDQVPVATQLTASVEFFIEAEYGLTPGGTVDFESSIDAEWLDTGDWTVTTAKARSGTASLRSPVIGNSEATTASATFNTWGGYLSFNYAVESEAGYDFFNVYVDGNRVLSASGYQPEFKSANIFLAPGEHTIVWEYVKDDSVGHNKDAVWIDDIQFPVLAGGSSEETVSHNILTGNLSVTAYKLDEPWQFTSQSYLPGDVRISAIFSNQFLVGEGIEEDNIHLTLAANIANAADFEPPQPYDEGTLAILGNYTVSESLFTFNLQDWSIHITPAGNQTYLYEVYQSGEDEPVQSYLATSTKLTLKDVAGELINNSGIGMNVVVPQEGLYITTLLKSSPWGTYKDSRFSATGGDIYGYLVDPFDPTESEDQFLKIAVSFAAELKPFDLPDLTFGSHFTRDTLNEGTFSFYVIVDGKRFNFTSQYWYHLIGYGGSDASVDLKSPKLIIENQDGVKLELVFPDVKNVGGNKEEPAIEGKLVYNNKVYGTIKRVKGITAIEYIDNTGESIP